MRADYLIPEHNVETFELLIADLSKRSEKLGAGPIVVESKTAEKTTTYFASKMARELKIESLRTWFRIVLVGETPKLSGWTFVAKLDHTDAGNIVRVVPGADLPESYRTAGPACDHCGHDRRRNSTFVLRHEDGRTAQVGSTCLADFTGHDDPHSIAKLAELLGAFAYSVGAPGGEEDAFGGGGHDPPYSIREFLAAVAVVIRVEGWKSRSVARDFGGLSTSDMAFDYLDPWSKAAKEWAAKIGDATDADLATADAAIEWVRTSFEGRDLSDFEHNVKVIVAGGRVVRKTGGIAAAIIPSHARALDRIAERAKTEDVPSEYVGTVGERIELPVEIAAQIPVESDFGFSLLVKMTDGAGNVLSTFYSGSKSVPAVGEKVTLRATVKGHEEYRGTRQTKVSRAVWK